MDDFINKVLKYFEDHGDPEITNKMDQLLAESNELVNVYDNTISDGRALYIIGLIKPSLIINIACITGTMKELCKLREDNVSYLKAYFGYDTELANKIIKDTELLIAQLNTFIEEYSVIAEQY